MQNISCDITNIVARQKAGLVFYFDENGIYRCISIEEAKKHKELRPIIRIDGSVSFDGSLYYSIGNINGNLLKKCICRLKVGDSIENLDNYISSTTLERRPKAEGIERFITKINRPIFARIPENPNKKTFDFIFMQVNIISKWEKDRGKYINDHLEEIKEIVIKKLKSSRSFQRYGVPVNFLRITKITLKRDNTLEFVLELKKIE